MPRYPNELQLTEDDAKSAIRFAEEIKEFVVSIACSGNPFVYILVVVCLKKPIHIISKKNCGRLASTIQDRPPVHRFVPKAFLQKDTNLSEKIG